MHKKEFSRTVRISIGPQSDGDRRRGAVSPVRRDDVTPVFGAGEPYAAELFDRLYDASLITTDVGAVQTANPRAADFLQYTTSDLTGRAIHEFIPGLDDTLLRELQDDLNKNMFILIDGFCLRKDRSLFPAEIAIARVQFQSASLCFFIRDITRRRETEDMLRTGYLAMQNAASGIAILNREGEIDYVNPAILSLWGYERPNHLLRRSVRDLFEGSTVLESLMGAVCVKNVTWAGELSAKHADGHTFPVHLTAAPNKNAERDILGSVLSMIDLTERKQAEEAIQQTERQKAMLASVGAACHHLAQPATVIMGNLSVIQRNEDELPESTRAMVHSALLAADQLSEILHRLNSVEEYRTTRYLESIGDGREDNQLLDI